MVSWRRTFEQELGEEDSDSHEDSVYDSFYTVWKASKDLFPAAPL